MNQDIVISKGKTFHSACILVQADPRRSVDYIRKGENLPHWLIDTPIMTEIGSGVFKLSQPDMGFVKLEAQGSDITYFHVGRDIDQLNRRILMAIHEGPPQSGVLNENAPPSCLVNLIAWRIEDMTDLRWQDLCRRHETEIRILKRVLEQSL